MRTFTKEALTLFEGVFMVTMVFDAVTAFTTNPSFLTFPDLYLALVLYTLYKFSVYAVIKVIEKRNRLKIRKRKIKKKKKFNSS